MKNFVVVVLAVLLASFGWKQWDRHSPPPT